MQTTNIVRLSAARRLPVTARAVRVRNYNTPPPPPSGQPAPNPMAKKSDNTMMYTALGIATAAGAYIYFKNPEVSHEAKARKDELEKKARVEMDKAKSRAGDMVQKGEGKVEQMKEGTEARMGAARDRADEAARRFEARGKSFGEDVEEKYDAAKANAKQGVAKARESAEHLLDEGRAETSKKAEEAKESWSSWVGWGKSKVDEDAEKIRAQADATKRDAAQGVANVAGDVRSRAEKHA